MGGSPEINFSEAEVISNSNVADLPGSKLLCMKAADKSKAQYSPGHVSAICLEQTPLTQKSLKWRPDRLFVIISHACVGV